MSYKIYREFVCVPGMEKSAISMGRKWAEGEIRGEEDAMTYSVDKIPPMGNEKNITYRFEIIEKNR